MVSRIKPTFSPDEAREVLQEQRAQMDAQVQGQEILDRRYKRDEAYRHARQTVYELYLQGYTPVEIPPIATAMLGMKVTLARVDAYIRSAVNDQKRYTQEERRAIENSRLDYYLVKLKDNIERGDDKAIGRAVEISKRRSALNGTDAPVKVSHQGAGDIDPSLLGLVEAARKTAQSAIADRYPHGIEDAEVVEPRALEAPDEDEDEDGYVDVDLAGDVPDAEL